MNKVCTKCLVNKPLDDFNPQARGLHGRRSQCKECLSAIKAKKYANGEKLERLSVKLKYRARETKVCRECKAEKPKIEFHEAPENCDGLNNSCKLCRKAYRRIQYIRDPEKYIAQANAWKLKYPERWAAYQRGYGKDYRKNNPVIAKAWAWVTYELKKGTLIPEPCIVCGNPETEAHHPDHVLFSQIQWLCHDHHGRANQMDVPKIYSKELDDKWEDRYKDELGRS